MFQHPTGPWNRLAMLAPLAHHSPLSCQAAAGKAHTYHVFDQQVSTGEGNGVGGCGDRQHEGVGAADGARDHQVQGVHVQPDSLAQRSHNWKQESVKDVETVRVTEDSRGTRGEGQTQRNVARHKGRTGTPRETEEPF